MNTRKTIKWSLLAVEAYITGMLIGGPKWPIEGTKALLGKPNIYSNDLGTILSNSPFGDEDALPEGLGDIQLAITCLEDVEVEGLDIRLSYEIAGVLGTLQGIRDEILKNAENDEDAPQYDHSEADVAQTAAELKAGDLNIWELENDQLGRLTQAARLYFQSTHGYAGSGDPTPMIHQFLTVAGEQELKDIIKGQTV